MGMGRRDSIYAQRDILDRAWVSVEYANGVQAALGVCMFFEPEEQLELGVLGTAGKATCRIPERRLELDTRAGRSLRDFAASDVGGFAHGGEIEQQVAFVDAIRNGRPQITDVSAARWSIAVSLAAEAAISTGSIVSLAPTGHAR
jgi:hypothetical protein